MMWPSEVLGSKRIVVLSIHWWVGGSGLPDQNPNPSLSPLKVARRLIARLPFARASGYHV